MNIIKPQKTLLSNLIKLENLLEEIENKDLIQNKLIENVDVENSEIYDIKFENVIFNNVNIIEWNLEKNTFLNL